MADPESKVEIEILKRDIDAVVGLADKFDVAIDRLSEVSINIEKMLAVHESRLQTTEKQNEIIHQRITDFKKDISDKIDNLREENETQHKEVSERIARLEKWKWFVVGIGAAIGFLMSTIISLKDLFN